MTTLSQLPTRSFPFGDWPHDKKLVRAALMSIDAFRDPVAPDTVNIAEGFLELLRQYKLVTVDARSRYSLTQDGRQVLRDLDREVLAARG